MSEVKADRLTAAYIKMRDKRKVMAAEFERADAEIEAQMHLVEEELMKICRELGADSITTEHGTVYRTVKTRYETTDWESMYNFIKEHDIPQVLERRISTTNMKQFLDENPDLMPIGLQADNRYVVRVRKPTTR